MLLGMVVIGGMLVVVSLTVLQTVYCYIVSHVINIDFHI